jgi:hypothetical protein
MFLLSVPLNAFEFTGIFTCISFLSLLFVLIVIPLLLLYIKPRRATHVRCFIARKQTCIRTLTCIFYLQTHTLVSDLKFYRYFILALRVVGVLMDR